MRKIQQQVIRDPNYPRTINTTSASANEAAVQLLQGSEGGDIIPIGIAYHLSSKGLADYICLANQTEAFVISFKSKTKMPFTNDFAALLHSGSQTNDKAATSCGKKVCLVGFDMARIAIQVNGATHLDVKGVKVSTLLPHVKNHLPSGLAKTLGTVDTRAIDSLRIDKFEKDVVIQSWLAACIGCRCKDLISSAEKLDTQHISPSERACLLDLVRESDLLEGIQPTVIESDFSKADLNSEGEFLIGNSRYKSRVRKGKRTQVILTDDRGKEALGRAKKVNGKTATIALKGTQRLASGVQTVRVVGRPDPINSEIARDQLLCLVLAGRKMLSNSPFIARFWFSKHLKNLKGPQPTWIIDPESLNTSLMQMSLNDSQRSAVRAMVGHLPIVIVHGPPGTGKTSTIAAASKIWDIRKLPVWIIAHSNVAVKNIAESFCKRRIKFKLIVSKEFYVEWHEHIYSGVEENLICTDHLPKAKVGMERLILDSTIMLSTLSALSNPKLHANGTFQIVPPTFLVIDEASQISVFEFMHVFEKFGTTLRKVCFFGDPKQLPPYGQESAKTMKTIFDLPHLKGRHHFLNIQYRMPIPIADFISRRVYDGKLGSEHNINSPKCLALIDVPRTGEESLGSSKKNTGEVDTINHLVKEYYKTLDFCVITPYDAQRAAIQKSLEGEKLPFETVFNVDSFQGNEADFVIVSLVRSSHVGFLQSLNRMNVLLTRCRKGLIIVSSRAFLGADGKGASTLVGGLVKHWETRYPSCEPSWIDWRSVAEGSVDLPGVPAPKPRRLSPSITTNLNMAVAVRPPLPPLASGSKALSSTKPATRDVVVVAGPKKTSSPKRHWKPKGVAQVAGTSHKSPLK